MEAIATIKCHWDDEHGDESISKQLHLPVNIEDKKKIIKEMLAEMDKRATAPITYSAQLEFYRNIWGHQQTRIITHWDGELGQYFQNEPIAWSKIELLFSDLIDSMYLMLSTDLGDE